MNVRFSRRSFFRRGLAASALAFFRGPASQAQPTEKPVNLKMKYSRLASPFTHFKSFYEVVIIGSGYGGSIMAARLSRHYEVAILERGKEWSPGDFPESLSEVKQEMRCETQALGLFSYHPHREIDVLCGSGLGGTSLINAGVVIKPDPELFIQSAWPREIQRDSRQGMLEKYFARVNSMLAVQTYDPQKFRCKKAENLKRSSRALGEKFYWAQLAVNIHSPRRNQAGDIQPACHRCGNCSTGCNTGAKNTLNMNYLPLAKRNGAQIFPQMEVSYLELLPNQNYLIHGIYHSTKAGAKNFAVEARNVIVSAGTMGSTEILLRSRKFTNLPLSQVLGKRFSGNGDFLGLGYNGSVATDIIGNPSANIIRPDMSSGTTIYGITDYRSKKNIHDRFLIEEGNIPGALVDLSRRLGPLLKFQRSRVKLFRAWLDFINSRHIEKGALNHSMVYFGMGHDQACGEIHLNNKNRGIVSWPRVNEDPIYGKILAKIQEHSSFNNSTYVKNPRSTLLMGNNLITVHPLGGCSMGDSVHTGVVNHLGQVYRPDGSLHEGLFVMDGSILPTAIGVNPLLTISALAERAAEQVSLR